MVIAVLFLVIKCLNYRLHLMFDGEEIRTESEQQEVRHGEPGAKRDENSRVEVSSGPADIGGEVLELEVMNHCSEDVANEGGEENVAQPTTTTTALTMPPHSSSSLVINSSSVPTAAILHKVQLLDNCNIYLILLITSPKNYSFLYSFQGIFFHPLVAYDFFLTFIQSLHSTRLLILCDVAISHSLP